MNTGKEIVSDNDLLNALTTTNNIRQALIKVGLTPKGLNYKRASKLLNIQYSTDKFIDIKNSQFNTVWINNNSINKKVKKEQLDEYLNAGWHSGRLVSTKPPSSKGKMWVTDGVASKFVNTSNVPVGWWPGRVL